MYSTNLLPSSILSNFLHTPQQHKYIKTCLCIFCIRFLRCLELSGGKDAIQYNTHCIFAIWVFRFIWFNSKIKREKNWTKWWNKPLWKTHFCCDLFLD